MPCLIFLLSPLLSLKKYIKKTQLSFIVSLLAQKSREPSESLFALDKPGMEPSIGAHSYHLPSILAEGLLTGKLEPYSNLRQPCPEVPWAFLL